MPFIFAACSVEQRALLLALAVRDEPACTVLVDELLVPDTDPDSWEPPRLPRAAASASSLARLLCLLASNCVQNEQLLLLEVVGNVLIGGKVDEGRMPLYAALAMMRLRDEIVDEAQPDRRAADFITPLLTGVARYRMATDTLWCL